LPSEYKNGETLDGTQEGPLLHGSVGGASGTVSVLELTSSGHQGVVLYDGSGNLITATTNGADHGLDINVINDTVVVATGSGVPSNVVPVGGSDGANARIALFTTSGELVVSVTDMAGGDTMAYGNATLTSSAALLIASNAARRGWQIQNLDTTNFNCYWGSDSSVTTANATEILPGGVQSQSGLGTYTGDIYIISDGTGTTNGIRYIEIDKA
jgi:hypothetical protein